MDEMEMEKVGNILPYVARRKTGTDPAPMPAPLRKAAQQPMCLVCRDRGFTRADVPVGHESFGKAIPCSCTQLARKGQHQRELVELSGIDTLSRFKKATFETFKKDAPDVGYAFRHAKQFAARPDGWLVLTGPCGCGKTHLAVAIAKERVQAGDTVLIATVPDLLDMLRSAYSPSVEQSFEERFTQMKEADVLFLDDYGAEQGTGWAVEKMFQLFNYRYTRELPTVVTSNNIHLEGIDQRVYSRLHDRDLVTLVKMEQAHDYRSRGEEE